MLILLILFYFNLHAMDESKARPSTVDSGLVDVNIEQINYQTFRSPGAQQRNNNRSPNSSKSPEANLRRQSSQRDSCKGDCLVMACGSCVIGIVVLILWGISHSS